MKQIIEKYVEDLLICVEDTKGFYIYSLLSTNWLFRKLVNVHVLTQFSQLIYRDLNDNSVSNILLQFYNFLNNIKTEPRFIVFFQINPIFSLFGGL